MTLTVFYPCPVEIFIEWKTNWVWRYSLMFARTRGYILVVQWHYFKYYQCWHNALHNMYENRRHILPIYLIIITLYYLTKNTVTIDGFQSYEENRRLILLIYAVILKLSTFLGLSTFLDINFSFLLFFNLLINFFCPFSVLLFFLLFFKNFFFLAFYCSRKKIKNR